MNWLKQKLQRIVFRLTKRFAKTESAAELVKHTVIRHVPVKGNIVTTYECYYTRGVQAPRHPTTWEQPEQNDR